jgi:hypothetical protein
MTAKASRCITIILAALVLEDAERRGLRFREEMSRKPGARPLGWRISMRSSQGKGRVKRPGWNFRTERSHILNLRRFGGLCVSCDTAPCRSGWLNRKSLGKERGDLRWCNTKAYPTCSLRKRRSANG